MQYDGSAETAEFRMKILQFPCEALVVFRKVRLATFPKSLTAPP